MGMGPVLLRTSASVCSLLLVLALAGCPLSPERVSGKAPGARLAVPDGNLGGSAAWLPDGWIYYLWTSPVAQPIPSAHASSASSIWCSDAAPKRVAAVRISSERPQHAVLCDTDVVIEDVGDDRKPAWTLAPVPALALEGMLVEIDVIAVVPH
jgi:hypothetical protein